MTSALFVLFIGWLGFVFAVGNLIDVACKRFYKPEGTMRSVFRMFFIAFGFTVWYFFVFMVFPIVMAVSTVTPTGLLL